MKTNKYRSLALAIAVASLAGLVGQTARAETADDLYAAMSAGKCSPALTSLKASAEAGDPSAQDSLGIAYINGLCKLPKSDELAFGWIRKAAEQGLAGAQRNAGLMYAAGQGVGRDERMAVDWLQKAAAQGDASALNSLGNHYYNGQGVAKDWKAAAAAYRKAAEQGERFAQYNLASMYDAGEGMAKDEREALAWYLKAAEQGHPESQYTVGVKYSFGRGVAKDERVAVGWYRKAAEQGHILASNNLGAAYEDGRGALQDHVEAVRLYEVAARANSTWGQRNLGRMLRDGKGTDANIVQAHAWLNLAASAEKPQPDAIKERDALAAEMSSAQLAEAQRLAREWKPGAAMGMTRLKQPAPAPAATRQPVASADPYPPRPAARPGVVTCSTRCNNGDCYRSYADGRKSHFQAQRKFNPMNNQWEFDAGNC